MAFMIAAVEPSLVAAELLNAVRITFRRGCLALKVGLDGPAVGHLPRFWPSTLLELLIVAI